MANRKEFIVELWSIAERGDVEAFRKNIHFNFDFGFHGALHSIDDNLEHLLIIIGHLKDERVKRKLLVELAKNYQAISEHGRWQFRDFERRVFEGELHHFTHTWSYTYDTALERIISRMEKDEPIAEALLPLIRALKVWFRLISIEEDELEKIVYDFRFIHKTYHSLSRILSRIDRIEDGSLMAEGLEVLSNIFVAILPLTDYFRQVERDTLRSLDERILNVEDRDLIRQLKFFSEDFMWGENMPYFKRSQPTLSIEMEKVYRSVEIDTAPLPAPLLLERLIPPPRYADFTFFSEERGLLGQRIPDGNVLQVEKWYQLEIAVRITPTGIPPEKPDRSSLLEPKQIKNVTIMVATEGEGFEIAEPVQTLTLPPIGDSTENAIFRVRPLRKSTNANDLSEILVRLYYEFNLIEVAIIRAEITGKFDNPLQSSLGLPQPITFRQERLERNYLDFDNVQPRAMQIDITKNGDYFLFNFAFRNDLKQKLEYTAPARVPATDLEDSLVGIRKIWYDIAMSKTFTEYLQGDEDEFIQNICKLAKEGRNLWNKLFKFEYGSSLYNIGKWLEEHPLKEDGIVQITLSADAASCVFPWALIYDRALPINSYELPELEGFWGIRYCIEQHQPQQIKRTDEPININDELKIGFMLWEQFKNADQEKLLMEKLINQSKGKLQVTTPPITKVSSCYELLTNCDANILYFYTHGYTRHRRADIGVGRDLDLLRKYFQNTPPASEAQKKLYDSITQNSSDYERSWIELSYGKLYLDELPDKIEGRLNSCPLVILNMCESAQITPSLSDSFIHFFLNRGAIGVIGTECSMTIKFAHPFAEMFLQEILSGVPVGMALLKARRYFLTLKNPLGLAYTLFGLATASFKPPILEKIEKV